MHGGSAAKRVLVVIAGLLGVAASLAAPAQAHTPTPTGNDISYPQCGRSYPSGSAFAIVGVNGGKASNFNSCFASEWSWAQTAAGLPNQPRAQLYINTGNPGDVLAQYNVQDWPSTSVAADPYGGTAACSGTWNDNLGCSWEYGYERATADINVVGSAGGAWWLDIETSNSWTSDTAKNQASLEGMVYALSHPATGTAATSIGIYASSGSWSTLFGSVRATSPLYSLEEWRPGAKTLSRAQTNCALAPFEGNGRVALTQYVSTNVDYDYSCP